MSRKKDRQFQLVFVSLAVALITLTALLIGAASAYEPHAPWQPEADSGPPLRDCPRDVDTWTCIRGAMWRKP